MTVFRRQYIVKEMTRRTKFTGSTAMARFGRHAIRSFAYSYVALGICLLAQCQAPPPESQNQLVSLVINLKDALSRARKYGLQLDAATLAVAQAREDRIQAKAA